MLSGENSEERARDAVALRRRGDVGRPLDVCERVKERVETVDSAEDSNGGASPDERYLGAVAPRTK